MIHVCMAKERPVGILVRFPGRPEEALRQALVGSGGAIFIYRGTLRDERPRARHAGGGGVPLTEHIGLELQQEPLVDAPSGLDDPCRRSGATGREQGFPVVYPPGRRDAMSVRSTVEKALEQGKGILRLAPNWVPRSFCVPGRRLKLHPADYYSFGGERGGIDERWPKGAS